MAPTETDRDLVEQIAMLIDTPILDLTAAQRIEFATLCIHPGSHRHATPAMVETWRRLSDGERGLLTVAYHLDQISRVRGHFDLHRQSVVAGYLSLWVGEWVREGRR